MHTKNNDSVNHTYLGQLILPGEYYKIMDIERLRWANRGIFLKDVANSIALMARDDTGSSDILDINEGINFLKEIPTPVLADYSDIFYAELDSESESLSGGIVIPSGQDIGILRFKGNGQDPNAYVMLVFDRGGAGEKNFGVIKTEDDIKYDMSLPYAQVTGDGVAKLQLVLVNNSAQSAAIGGLFEAINLV